MSTARRRDGFALMAALWLVVIVGATGYELSVRSRTARLAVANSLEQTAARAAAEAGLETARARLEDALSQPLTVTRTPLGPLDPWTSIVWTRDTVELGDERMIVTAYDAGSRLQINRATEADLRRLLIALPMDASQADRLAQRILDWRDADGLRRGRGAERDDYLRAGARVLPPNANLSSIDELRDVDDMTPSLFARIAPLVTVYGSGQINVNAAPPAVLRSLPGITDEAIAIITRARQSSRPIRSMDELFAPLSPGSSRAIADAGFELAQRVTFESHEMVARSEGWVEGSPVRVVGEAWYARSGDALFAVSRRFGEP